MTVWIQGEVDVIRGTYEFFVPVGFRIHQPIFTSIESNGSHCGGTERDLAATIPLGKGFLLFAEIRSDSARITWAIPRAI